MFCMRNSPDEFTVVIPGFHHPPGLFAMTSGYCFWVSIVACINHSTHGMFFKGLLMVSLIIFGIGVIVHRIIGGIV